MNTLKKVLVLAGPTASGKTALSLRVAKVLDGEIVSADSMQVYRGMDIGTAKASPAEQSAVPHHMLDLLDPGEDYSVSRYVEDASAVCDELLAGGKLPVITGGTGLYIDALLAGRRFAGTEKSEEGLRASLSREYDRLGAQAMWQRLKDVDPERAALLAPTDRRRIIRALEICILTGETMTEHDRQRLIRHCMWCWNTPTEPLSMSGLSSGSTACVKKVFLMKQSSFFPSEYLTAAPACRPSATVRPPCSCGVSFHGRKPFRSSSRRRGAMQSAS